MSEVEHVKAAATVDPIPRDFELEPYVFGSFTFSASGLQVVGTPSIEEWTAVGLMLAVQVRGIQFQVGDWLLIGQALYGELAAQVIDARHWRPETVRNYKWLAESVPPQVRLMDRGLTVGHHVAVARLPHEEQALWLKRALGDDEAGHWTVARLEQAVKAGSELVAVAWHVLAECRDEKDQGKLLKALELEGRPCRPVTRLGAAAKPAPKRRRRKAVES